jgi:uncharacterized protein YjiS (DUF1127 family)
MADRSLRGMGIGFRSLESDYAVEFAERVETVYDCPEGHTMIVPFSIEAEIPTVWGCRCGGEAFARDCDNAHPTVPKPARSHWEMLLERRTVAELEELLAERLEDLRRTRGSRQI